MACVCSACGFENRDGRKFCARCGVRLGLVCPACGRQNELDEDFCGECGAALAPARWTPGPTLTGAVQGERKQLSVLFADIQGSMDLQEDLDPEMWAQIMVPFAQILADGVRKFGGTVDKFTGDGIMALFGAPVAQEDHARRACHAAWYLTKAIAAYADELRGSQQVDLHVRLGVNSGEVIVGPLGEDLPLDATALGYTVGLAQRMEAMAEPGTAYLTEYTARLVGDWFHLENLGLIAVKGAREPLTVYVLRGPVLSPPAMRSVGVLGVTPLVGRDREVAAAEDALAAAIEGEAQVVGIVGEAGVGKSRLCDELARSATAHGLVVRRTTGVSHGRDLPLLPILALLRDYFAITDSDSPEEARAKIAGRLLGLDPGLVEALPLLFDFLEVPDPRQRAPKLAPEVRMRTIFATLRWITERRSEREVLILIFEDLHWFDPQSLAFLERLIESFQGSRTLVVVNFRPGFSASWMRKAFYRQVALSPLRDEAVAELLGSLLGADFSLAPLLGFVLERTGGNPFFIEELVRALVDDGTLGGGGGSYRLNRALDLIHVPPNVQSLLAARIDKLPEREKRLLQAAAVIGRTFSQPVLRKVAGLSDDDLDAVLFVLCEAGFVQTESVHPIAVYRFWHPLTQDVAYQSLLSERRARLHRAIASALIDIDEDRLDEQAALIASHWAKAGERFEAARWTARAANWALRSDFGEAWRRWQETVELLEGVAETPESLELGVRVRGRLVQFGARTGVELEQLERLASEGRALGERLGNDGLLSWTIVVSGSTQLFRGHVAKALDRYLEGDHWAQKSADPMALLGVCLGVAIAYAYTGPLEEGLAWVDRGLAACGGDPELGASLVGYSPLVRLHQFRARLLGQMGRLSEAHGDAQKAVAQARSRAEPETLGWSLAVLAQLGSLTGEGGDPVTANEAIRLSEQTGDIGSLVLGLAALAMAHLSAGRASQAMAACERALLEAREHGSGLFEEANLLAYLAQARQAAGDRDGALAVAEQAVEVSRVEGARVSECLALLTRAQARRATGAGVAEIRADLDSALALAGEVGAHVYDPLIHEELGRDAHDPGEFEEAVRLYTAIGAVGHAQRLQAELEKHRGNRTGDDRT
jgi:class 3 adenylate cyclase/tetratricopeptide (TPR) repeat protein